MSYVCLCRWSYNPHHAVTSWVWAVPRSLATTCGITIVFFSYGYLDVSVPHVRLSFARDIRVCTQMGCPIRKSPDQRLFAPTRSLSQLVTSFFASESQGIHHLLLFTSVNTLISFKYRSFSLQFIKIVLDCILLYIILFPSMSKTFKYYKGTGSPVNIIRNPHKNQFPTCLLFKVK